MSNTVTTVESDDDMHSRIHNESQGADNIGNGCRTRGEGRVMKKGPWTSTEDKILIDYVKKHRGGNWNAVLKHTSLARDGKSCRLRWANHLRPHLKKGTFSQEEEQLIVELHARMGNKWAKMAKHLPGRTDNEIKNYWNTRMKRRERAGLPIYPPEIHVERWSEEYTKSNNVGVDRSFEDPSFAVLDICNAIPCFTSLFSGASDLSHLVACNMLGTDASSSRYGRYMSPILRSPKQPRESGSQFAMCSINIRHEFQSSEYSQYTAPQRNPISCCISPCDIDHPPYGNQHSSEMMISDSHTFTDGIIPTSTPSFGAVKPELPSFQYTETGAFYPWETSMSPPLPDLLDSVDAYIQSPQPLEIEESGCFSSCDTGLLDMLLNEAQVETSAQIKSGEFEDPRKNWARSEIPIPTQHSAGGISSGSVVKTDQVWEAKRDDITWPDDLLPSSWLDQGCFGFD